VAIRVAVVVVGIVSMVVVAVRMGMAGHAVAAVEHARAGAEEAAIAHPGQAQGRAVGAQGAVGKRAADAVLVFVFLMPGLVQRRTLGRSEEHTSELESRENLVCRLL